MLAPVGAALVTGAGRGLGLEIARVLAGRGHTVHVTDVDEAAAVAAAKEVGSGAFGSALDVRDPGACSAAAAETAERLGSLDVWVNNAGVLVTGMTWEHDAETRRSVVDVNAIGTFNGTVAALEVMRPAGRGHIINVVSLAGLVAAPGEALYAASKHAAIAFSIGTLIDLRRSGERGIDVSALCPDGIWTPMISGKLDDPHAAPSFSGKLMSPAEAAQAVGSLLDRPRAVLTVPRWRGAVVRLFDLFPGLAVRMVPALMADARRRQRRWKKRIEAGESP
jgi:NAD(P)-dependent dehydrogenase (short-subunit alcohol dehydrogenase family)